MSILIKGMEMPEKIEPGLVIEFADDIDGKRYARLYHDQYGGLTGWLEAVSVPPHGRLGDLDEMIWKLTPDEEFYPTEEDRLDYDNGKLMIRDIRGFIRDQPTIIPAEEGNT